MKFLYPEVFYMMLIPLILLIVLVLTSRNTIEKYFSQEILQKLSVGGKVLDQSTRNGLLFFCLILFIIALGRPVIDEKEQEFKQKLIPIVVAIDVSRSMMATDIYPNRISLAVQKLKQIIQTSQNATIGLLLFAKDSFVLSPVTEDFISLRYIVDNIDTNLNFPNGSNIFATLEATDYMLEDFQTKNLIILSDGGNSENYEEEIVFAKNKNIAVYSIGIATKQGSPIPTKEGYLTNEDGDIVTVKLNQAIKNLSLKTQGGYIDFSLDNSDVEAIISRINTQSKKEELLLTKYKTYTELFYYPLGLGLFVLLLSLSSFPRKTNTIIPLLSIVFLSSVDIKAEIFQFKTIQKANQHYQQQEFSQSAQQYRKLSATPQSLYNLGNTLYKEEKYQEALESYSKVVTQDESLEAKKLHNIGNSYVKLNELQKAKKFYEKALKVKEDKQTKENLQAVEEALKKQEEQKKQNNQQQENKEEQQENQEKKTQQQKDKEEQQQQKQQEKSEKNSEKNKGEDTTQKEEQQGENKEQSPSQNQSQTTQEKPIQQEISKMEEKKWMEQLENQAAPLLLRKAETTKESKTDETQPW